MSCKCHHGKLSCLFVAEDKFLCHHPCFVPGLPDPVTFWAICLEEEPNVRD